MASGIGETAKLVASLELKDHFSPAAKKAEASLGRLESKAFRAGQTVGRGLKNTAKNLRNIAVVAGAGIAFEVKQGIDSLAQLETATTSVTGAIGQMGQTGKVTAAQVAQWANEIETSVQAAFDDKDITAAASTLIRFGKVVPSNLHQSLVVMTDLAAKTGSVDSAASLLAKALADPTKAAGKLARSGVVLTKEQQKTIKAMVKQGKTAKAQKFILDQLSKTTKGAAAASVGEYGDALNMLNDATEDAQRALAVGFLPVIKRVSNILTTELAKPSTINAIRDFGENLAKGLDSLISIAGKLPWATIGDSLRLAGDGAKAVLNAFTSLPSWVQTAVLTGWGLNKLTGGVIGDVIGDLAKGLIKGVLGINAGVVNINAGVVNGGGVGGAAGGAAAKGMGLASKVFLVGEAIGLAAAVHQVWEGVNKESSEHVAAIQQQTATWLAQQPSREDLTTGLAAINTGLHDLRANPLNVLVQGDAIDKLEAMRKDTENAIQTSVEKQKASVNLAADKQKAAVAAAAMKSTNDAERIKSSAAASVAGSTSQIVAGLNRVVGAVGAIDVRVSSYTINKTTAKQTFYGPTQSSRNVGRNSPVREFG